MIIFEIHIIISSKRYRKFVFINRFVFDKFRFFQFRVSLYFLYFLIALSLLLTKKKKQCRLEEEPVSSGRRNSIVWKKKQYRLEGDASKQIRSGHLSANSRIKAIITLLPRPVKVPANNAPKRESLGEGDSWEERPLTAKQIDDTWEFKMQNKEVDFFSIK